MFVTNNWIVSVAEKNLGVLLFWVLVYKEDPAKLQPRKNILYTILPITSFTINYNKKLTNHD